MNIKINIDCDDHIDAMQHISVIRHQLKKAFKKNEDFEGLLEDGNCYGEHQIIVTQEPGKN